MFSILIVGSVHNLPFFSLFITKLLFGLCSSTKGYNFDLLSGWWFQMLVNDIGDVTITNDGVTILKMLEVEHPATKVDK